MKIKVIKPLSVKHVEREFRKAPKSSDIISIRNKWKSELKAKKAELPTFESLFENENLSSDYSTFSAESEAYREYLDSIEIY